MATIAAAAARTSLRSAATKSFKFSTPKTTPSPSPFRVSPQKPLSARIFRSPVEMSCAVPSMLPYHTATASALLNSMLSAAPRGYAWIIEDC